MSLWSFRSSSVLPPESGPNAIGCCPNPGGIISATGASPAFTAASAVAAVYSGPVGTPFWFTGVRCTQSEPSCSSARTRFSEPSLLSWSTTINVTFGVELFSFPKITAKMVKNARGNTKLNTIAPRSRLNAINAVLATFQINLVTPFPSGAEKPTPGSVSAAIDPPAPAPPLSRHPAAEQSLPPARS